jgi:hypothetical protein
VVVLIDNPKKFPDTLKSEVEEDKTLLRKSILEEQKIRQDFRNLLNDLRMSIRIIVK